MRVGLEHFGQSVLLLVSMTFLRSPVLAIFAIMLVLPGANIAARALNVLVCHPRRQAESIIRYFSSGLSGTRPRQESAGEELRSRLCIKSTRELLLHRQLRRRLGVCSRIRAGVRCGARSNPRNG